MAFFDRSGWMKSIEEPDPYPEFEDKALPIVLTHSTCPDDALELIKMLGLEEAVQRRRKCSD